MIILIEVYVFKGYKASEESEYKKALQNQEFCSISKPERLRNRSIPNAFGIRGFRSRDNVEIEQKSGFA